MAKEEQGVKFVGRLASYKYFNMDLAILNALEFFDSTFFKVNKKVNYLNVTAKLIICLIKLN